MNPMTSPATVLIRAHGPHTPLTLTRYESDVPRAVALLRESGYTTITARVAPSTNISEAGWTSLFRAEAMLRELGILEYATYNE